MMSGQINFHLNVNDPSPVLQPVSESPSNGEEYQINLQLANGWAIRGHYKNNMLQTITLQKNAAPSN